MNILEKLRLEIFIGGFLSVLLIGIPIYIKEPLLHKTINNFLFDSLSKDYIALIILCTIVIIYLLGHAFNGIGFALTDHLFARRTKKNIFKSEYEKYYNIKTFVLNNNKGTNSIRLDGYHNNIRLTRSVMLSLLLASIIFSVYNFSLIYILIFMSIFVGLIYQLSFLSKQYYTEMYETYKNLKANQ